MPGVWPGEGASPTAGRTGQNRQNKQNEESRDERERRELLPDWFWSTPTMSTEHFEWTTHSPKRLKGTVAEDLKQVWLVEWTTFDRDSVAAYVDRHEAEARRAAERGGVGVLVYDLRRMTAPPAWRDAALPFVRVHQRLNDDRVYAKWLSRAVVVMHDATCCTLMTAAIQSFGIRPTRPTAILCFDDAVKSLGSLWQPRSL